MNNNKYKILLVENEENIRNLVCTMLEAQGYQVLLAATCGGGNMMIASHLPDLIILDLGLPDGDGINLLTEYCGKVMTYSAIINELGVGYRLNGGN